MKYIISANYRNRSSDFPWLVREETQAPEAAKAYKTVTAQEVTFERSSKREQGYGCSMVAVAASVVASGMEGASEPAPIEPQAAPAPEIHNPDGIKEPGEGWEFVNADYVTKEGDGHEWYSAFHEWLKGDEFGGKVAEQYEIDTVRIPKRKEEHNPSNLTREQLGEGWAFAEPGKPMPEGYQYWEFDRWNNGRNNEDTPTWANPTRSVRVPIEVKKAEPIEALAPVAEPLKRLKFMGSYFKWMDELIGAVEKVAILQLNADGSMEARA